MRKTTILNADWLFRYHDGTETRLDIPHTWNNLDGQDGGDDYWRGTCVYEKTFPMPAHGENELVYLQFNGVNASAKVILNGAVIMTHDGGYSTFRADITDHLKEENHMIVEVDNSKNDRVYPQKADFTFYGGIYRDVLLLTVNKNHFDLDHHGGPGIAVTPTVDGKTGRVNVRTWITGKGEVSIALKDADGNVVASGTGCDCDLAIENVHLWDGIADPYLYSCEAVLTLDGVAVDAVSTPFGVRFFHVDPQKGFFLNGRSYPLRGVCRHQDWKGIGNALHKEYHDIDMAMIREIGANTIRLAHYQHDQYFYDLCDKYGFVVWAEIPYISEHMPAGRENTIQQMTELIIQNYNHPSICVWGISNEITISTRDNKDMLDNHRVLNDLVHQLDPTRPTTLACYAVCGPFNPVAHKVSDLVSWNLYLGWYVPGMFLNNFWVDFFEKRPFMWATHLWNMFDFAADARNQGGEPGMNHKGLVTFDRKIKKDSFYIYKAWWSSEPFVHICGKRFVDRVETITEVKVYSNQNTVTLYANGKEVATKTGSRVFTFKVHNLGEMKLEAVSGNLRDSAVIRHVNKPNMSYKLPKDGGNGGNWT